MQTLTICSYSSILAKSRFQFGIFCVHPEHPHVLAHVVSTVHGVRKMAPLGHCLWFWWLSNNAINGTNEFVKWTIIDPRDEAKRPSKAKYEERTQRNVELDEFYKNQWDRIHRWYHTGLTGWHRMHRCPMTGALGPSNAQARGEVQSSTGYTGGTNLRHRCKHHAIT